MGDYIRKFNVPTYSSGTSYAKYDIVKATNSNQQYYFVSTHDGNVGNINTSTMASSSHWKRFDDYNNDFADVWSPTFNTSVSTEPRVINSSLEDGTTLVARDGINTTPLRFQLSFENITDKEAFSLVCFADFLGGSRSFNWTVPTPYDKLLTFDLVNAQHNFVRKNVNNVTFSIESSNVIFGIGAGQVKFGDF